LTDFEFVLVHRALIAHHTFAGESGDFNCGFTRNITTTKLPR
jgi:hypothetical protein